VQWSAIRAAGCAGHRTAPPSDVVTTGSIKDFFRFDEPRARPPHGHAPFVCTAAKVATGVIIDEFSQARRAGFGHVTWVSYMAEASHTEYFIQGITKSGKKFRPSDWSERLAGVMSAYGPGAQGPNARLQYSRYVRPILLGDLKCVVLDSRLRDIEPMAFDFVINFAKDNDLVVTEACELPHDHGAVQKK
jgi:hypothetical protein